MHYLNPEAQAACYCAVNREEKVFGFGASFPARAGVCLPD
jgi:hypothetical protein